MDSNLISYFNKKVGHFDDDECWYWLGSQSSDGYGMVALRAYKGLRAHRLSYEIYKGPIPDDLLCCHTCDNILCVNPEHLFLGTTEDNGQDMSKKGRGRKRDLNKTHCKYGHELNEETSHITSQGYRVCRICRRDYERYAYHHYR